VEGNGAWERPLSETSSGSGKGSTGRSPQILALAVGKAPVERVWAERGYVMTFNEFRKTRWRNWAANFQRLVFLIGDIYQLVPESKHD